MAEIQEKVIPVPESDQSERLINSIALACNVGDKVKHIQIVVTANDDDVLKCYFDVLDETKIPKFAD